MLVSPISLLIVCITAASAQPASPWDGSFSSLYTNNNFCNAYSFGQNKPYICAGGGPAGPGGPCPAEACTSGQYSFAAGTGWTINIPTALAAGQAPYRAFAYLPFCNGQTISSCWGAGARSFGFRFRVERFAGWSGYTKILFWGDGGNDLLGLVPPSRGVTGVQLIAFPTDDLPSGSAAQLTLTEGTWYDVDVVFTPDAEQGTSAAITVNNAPLSTGRMNVDILTTQNGVQMGVYSFDNQGGTPTVASFDMSIEQACLSTTATSCLTAAPGRAVGGPPADGDGDGGGGTPVGGGTGGGAIGGGGTGGDRTGSGGGSGGVPTGDAGMPGWIVFLIIVLTFIAAAIWYYNCCGRPKAAAAQQAAGATPTLQLAPEVGFVSAQEEPQAAQPPPPSSQLLPEGWQELVDPNTKVAYFYNATSGESTWARPAEARV